MPISFGTSTAVIGFPLRLAAPLGCPPSYGFAATAAAAPPPQASGFTGSSSAPSHRPAAMALDARRTVPNPTPRYRNMTQASLATLVHRAASALSWRRQGGRSSALGPSGAFWERPNRGNSCRRPPIGQASLAGGELT